MTNYSIRSTHKELLDGVNIPFADIKRNMQELEFINAKLGGHQVSLNAVKSILKKTSAIEPIIICELGCGGGDNLKAILQWAKKDGVIIKAIGIDINAECIHYATQNNPDQSIEFICSDYKTSLPKIQSPSIIFSSLFCHHFSNDELISMFRLMQKYAGLACFINDLHRHPLAYWSIKIMTRMFSRSYLVKNDAPISVLRGFKKKELQNILGAAGISCFELKWKWAFRWSLIF